MQTHLFDVSLACPGSPRKEMRTHIPGRFWTFCASLDKVAMWKGHWSLWEAEGGGEMF